MKMCSVHIGGMEKSEKDFSTVVGVRKLSFPVQLKKWEKVCSESLRKLRKLA